MEEVADKINEYVLGYECNESLAGMIRKGINEQSKVKVSPKDYYYVTDLCNPCETYWKKIKPDVKRPNELLRRLFKGKELHKRASYWLSLLDDFSVYEGKIDGIYVDLLGVRGAIDYLLGGKIVDLKTKDKIPNTDEEVFSSYPQDIEQVVFYSLLHPENPIENYLLFMENKYPFTLKAFKIKIKDFGRIRSLLKDRIKKLDFAFANNNPSQLGRSRYHKDSCYLCESNLCNCEELSPLSIESLRLAIELKYDAEFTIKLTETKNKSKMPNNVFTIWNVLAPMECYKEIVLGSQSSSFTDDGKDEYILCLRNLIEKLPLKVNFIEKQSIKNSLKEPRLYLGFRWLKTISSANPKGNVLPYLIKVSNVTDSKSALRPNSFHLAQLGVLTSAYGKSRGLLFVVYPKLNDLIQVYEVNYKNPDESLRYIREVIDKLEKSISEKNISLLPPNPSFVKSDLQMQL